MLLREGRMWWMFACRSPDPVESSEPPTVPSAPSSPACDDPPGTEPTALDLDPFVCPPVPETVADALPELARIGAVTQFQARYRGWVELYVDRCQHTACDSTEGPCVGGHYTTDGVDVVFE